MFILRDITLDKAREIERIVTEELQEYGYEWERDTYVDSVAFAISRSYSVVQAVLDDNEDGFLAIQPDENSRMIGVNVKRQPEWKRFIVAHEYGHGMLHYQQGDAYLHRENKKGKDIGENEADYFAAALLMPQKSFERVYENLKDQKLSNSDICFRLADEFRVPLESVIRRIDEVTLLNQEVSA